MRVDAKVLPRDASLPILISHNTLNNRASISTLLVSAIRHNEEADDPMLLDLMDKLDEDDSAHCVTILAELTQALQANEQLNLSVPCPLSEVQVMIPMSGRPVKPHCQPSFSLEQVAIINVHICELIVLGFV
ncbi:hypothetical protein LPJ61_004363 [Coemansia biformis]|uniref:Uncharacterized protein n=1 Tax=Coemansia biformis TaxID=1286918 RepID=A0A9W7YAT5_9FUNG|nr:hypothetical protein LPJ61_004363 [Coemansia biformis]